MKRRLLTVLLMLGVGSILWGCTEFQSVPVVIDPEEQTQAIDVASGFATATITVTGKGHVALAWGDGQSVSLDLDLDEPVELTHDYAMAGTYKLTALQGQSTTSANVTATTVPPTLYQMFSYKKVYGEREKFGLTAPYREVGCAPYTLYGILPGDGPTEFRVTAWASTGEKVSLFDQYGRYVWGKWIKLVDDLHELQFLVGWALYSGETPLTPMNAMDCESDPTDPWSDADEVPSNAIRITFTLTARNPFMAERDYVSISWQLYVTASSCS